MRSHQQNGRCCRYKTLNGDSPVRIRTGLTDNGKEFTDRLFGLRKRAARGQREFDLLCTDLGIEHRLAPPQRPKPTAWSSASTAGSRISSSRTISDRARN